MSETITAKDSSPPPSSSRETADSVMERPSNKRPLPNYVQIYLKVVLSIVLSTLAGLATAAAGARHSNHAITPRILGAGALGGALTAVIISFARVMSLSKQSFFARLPILVISSTFGTTAVVTLAVCQYLDIKQDLAEKELLIGAMAAAAPLMVGFFSGDLDTRFGYQLDAILCIGFDALAGFTFVKVVQNHGVNICETSTGAACGAVYGSIIWAGGFLLGRLMPRRGKISDAESQDQVGNIRGMRGFFGPKTTYTRQTRTVAAGDTQPPTCTD